MVIVADILLAAGALAAGFYCFVLSRRLKRFTNLEHGVGGAIAVLSVQVDELSKALKQAEKASTLTASSLSVQSEHADAAAKRLELLIASLHDLPQDEPEPAMQEPYFKRQPVFHEEG